MVEYFPDQLLKDLADSLNLRGRILDIERSLPLRESLWLEAHVEGDSAKFPHIQLSKLSRELDAGEWQERVTKNYGYVVVENGELVYHSSKPASHSHGSNGTVNIAYGCGGGGSADDGGSGGTSGCGNTDVDNGMVGAGGGGAPAEYTTYKYDLADPTSLDALLWQVIGDIAKDIDAHA